MKMPPRREAKLLWVPTPGGLRFRVVEQALLGPEQSLPVSEWGRLKGQSALAGASMLLAWVDAGNDDWLDGNDSILLPHSLIAEFGAIEARRLGLPKQSPFVLDVTHSTTLDSPHFKFVAEWRDISHRRIIGIERTGSILTYGKERYILSNPLFGIVETITEFNANPPSGSDERLAAWGRIRSELIGYPGAPMSVGNYLKSINVLNAGALSLQARITPDGFRFNPLLYGQCAPVSDDGEDGTTNYVTNDRDNHPFGRLLPEALERRFAETVFQRDGARSRYVLDDGLFIVTGDIVKQALEIVRTVNQADAQTRNAFAVNPRPFFLEIAEKNGLAIDDFVVDAGLFSERVIGLGDWRRRTLGWLQKSGEVWLPSEEPHAVQIGDTGKSLIVVPADVLPLSQKLQNALDLGQTEIDWRGESIPVEAGIISELGKITGAVKPEESKERTTPAKPDSLRPTRVGLILKENEEELTFLREARAHDSSLGRTDAQDGLKTTLKRYQVEGVRWLQECFLKGSRGALLADDMGLGKTLVVLSFLSWLRRGIESSLTAQGRANGPARPPMPFLIVAPASLLGNWEAEERLHLNEVGRLGRLLKVYGPHIKELRLSKGKDVEIGGQTLDHNRIAAADWVLTTYETLSDYHLSFSTVPFVTVVFDETQKVKTPLIPITDAAKSIRSAFAIAMTGTPVENRLADIWTIMDVIWPGQIVASLKEFVNTYEKATDEARFQELFELLTLPRGEFPPLMLRRMKDDELDGLPKRTEKIVKTTMLREQASAFQAVVDSGRGSQGRDIMRVLQHMRGISLHPSPHDQSDERLYIERSARLKAAMEILDEVHRKDEKALIFVESRQIQPYLVSLLERRYAMKRRPMTINGSTLPAQRTNIVEKFQEARGFDVLVLGPKAAGTGLTLTAANHAIHLSRWWNPAVEDQCSDRIYRIGATKPITIYYLLAIHPTFVDESFDVKLHEILNKKREMGRRLLQPTALTHDELTGLWAGYGNVDGDHLQQTAERPRQFEQMDWYDFEEWVLERLKSRGYQVHRTPKTGDGGADGMFLKFGPDNGSGLIQCKHTSNPELVQDDTAVKNLIEARDRYGLKNPRLIAITNAKHFSRMAESMAGLEGIELVTRANVTTFHQHL